VDKIGNYRLQLQLASDSKSTTFRGQHLVLPRRANIRLMNFGAEQERYVELLREACLLDALHHPGIVRVYESGMHDGRPWFASEVVDAPALVDFVAPGAIDRNDALALLRDIAGVLEHASQRGVIHCGLRPERILLTGIARGYPVCVIEWSDARTHDAKPQPFTPTHEAWHYTSPELGRGDPIDDRTDVFSLGVIAYQMLTGKLPFASGILAVVDDGSMQHVPTEILAPDVMPDLAKLVDTMLAYDRWDRPSASEIHSELTYLAEQTYSNDDRPREILRIRRPRWTPPMQFRGERATTDVDIVPIGDDESQGRE
jgi:eukaryotic-like serine/threonine-protein kinase